MLKMLSSISSKAHCEIDMKLLMLYTDRFAYSPAVKTLDAEPDCDEPGEIKAAVVGLIHAEGFDEENAAGIESHFKQ